ETAVLGALAAPHLLHLVALEREREVARVLEDPARERHREVEVQAELLVRLSALLLLEATQHVDLLGGLTLAEQLVERLDRPRLDGREAVELEGLAQDVEDVLRDDAPLGAPLRKSGQGGGACHGPRSYRRARYGFVAVSCP